MKPMGLKRSQGYEQKQKESSSRYSGNRNGCRYGNDAGTGSRQQCLKTMETVYVNASASGTPQEITVSDWLKNSASSGNLSDVSDLKDIKNVKGDETFEPGWR